MTRILRRFGILSLIALFAVVGCGSGPSTATSVAPAALADAPTFSDAGLTQIRDTIGADITNQQIAGAVALLYADSEVKFFESFGSRDREGDRPMSNDTVFAIASMTKPITSFAVMMLHEEGHFELDDPVSTYIPELGGLEVGVEDGDGEGDGVSAPPPRSNITETPALLSGGGGLNSTAADYLRFCRMVLNGGELDGVRLATQETIDLMTSDHLDGRTGVPDGLDVGGFGLGFAYRHDLGSPPRRSVGELNWFGIFSTGFWIDLAKEIVGIYLAQVSPFDPGLAIRFRELAYDALGSSD